MGLSIPGTEAVLDVKAPGFSRGGGPLNVCTPPPRPGAGVRCRHHRTGRALLPRAGVSFKGFENKTPLRSLGPNYIMKQNPKLIDFGI